MSVINRCLICNYVNGVKEAACSEYLERQRVCVNVCEYFFLSFFLFFFFVTSVVLFNTELFYFFFILGC